jgi:hypothetical protein
MSFPSLNDPRIAQMQSPKLRISSTLFATNGETLLDSYSKYQLTKESDIFVALQGIAQDIMVETLKNRLMAGLLEPYIPEELCWTISSISGTSSAKTYPDIHKTPRNHPISFLGMLADWA